jgi:hypothetical protein
MEFAIIGIAVAFNFLVIKYKFEKKRYADGVLDVVLLTIISFLFAGSFGGLVVATVASAIISIILYAFPPKLPKLTKPQPSYRKR